jgi:hypothetical protein
MIIMRVIETIFLFLLSSTLIAKTLRNRILPPVPLIDSPTACVSTIYEACLCCLLCGSLSNVCCDSRLAVEERIDGEEETQQKEHELDLT